MRMETAEDVTKLGEIDPELKAILKKIGPKMPKPDFTDMTKLRAQSNERYKGIIAGLGPAEPHCTESDLEFPLRDGGTATARLWKPSKPAEGGSPLVVMFFGGGYVMGEVSQVTMYARAVARQYGATVLAPTYRLAPEDPWPAAPHDAWDAVAWAAEHAGEWGADLSQGFVIGGVSAGGNLAAVVGAQWAEEDHRPPLTGLWLSVPTLFGERDHVPERYAHLLLSRDQCNEGPILAQESLDAMGRAYKANRRDPRYAPCLRADALPKMPPVYFQVCGADPLRDDAVIYDKMLRDAGRTTLMHMYPGLVHAGWEFFPMLTVSRQARVDFTLGMGWLLDKEPREDPSAGPEWTGPEKKKEKKEEGEEKQQTNGDKQANGAQENGATA